MDQFVAAHWVDMILQVLNRRSAQQITLGATELYGRIKAIAATCGVKVDDIRVLKTAEYPFDNAFALGPSGVILSETLVRNLNRDEVDGVVAHELAHCRDSSGWSTLVSIFRTALPWLGLALLAEKVTGGVLWLRYVEWMSLFIMPSLSPRWYLRRHERIADLGGGELVNPRAVISGLLKLSAIIRTPLTRTWWSTIISSHPPVWERVQTVATRYGLLDQLDEIRREAYDHFEKPSDVYEVTYAQAVETPAAEIDRELTARRQRVINSKENAQDKAIYLGIMFLVVGAGIVFAGSVTAIGWHIIVTFLIALAIGCWMAVRTVSRHVRAIRAQVLDALRSKYGAEYEKSAILVDAMFGEDGAWQSAWLLVRDGKLSVLGESREVCVDLSGANVGQAVHQYDGDLPERAVDIRYLEAGVSRMLLLNSPICCGPVKRSPGSVDAIAEYLRGKQREATGGTYKVPPIPAR
jgi:hypothetical protein